jgi:hypothetical protein
MRIKNDCGSGSENYITHLPFRPGGPGRPGSPNKE